MAAITFYVNKVDNAKLRALADRHGTNPTKLCKNIIAEWVRVNLRRGEEED